MDADRLRTAAGATFRAGDHTYDTCSWISLVRRTSAGESVMQAFWGFARAPPGAGVIRSYEAACNLDAIRAGMLSLAVLLREFDAEAVPASAIGATRVEALRTRYGGVRVEGLSYIVDGLSRLLRPAPLSEPFGRRMQREAARGLVIAAIAYISPSIADLATLLAGTTWAVLPMPLPPIPAATMNPAPAPAPAPAPEALEPERASGPATAPVLPPVLASAVAAEGPPAPGAANPPCGACSSRLARTGALRRHAYPRVAAGAPKAPAAGAPKAPPEGPAPEAEQRPKRTRLTVIEDPASNGAGESAPAREDRAEVKDAARRGLRASPGGARERR